MPATVTGAANFTMAPSAWLVISELITMSVIGVLTAVSCEGKRARMGNFPSGMR